MIGLLVRVALLSVVPVLASAAGMQLDPLVMVLSLLAVIVEVGLLFRIDKRGRPKDRVLRNFVFELGAVYVLQLWLLILQDDLVPKAGGPHGPANAATAQSVRRMDSPIAHKDPVRSDSGPAPVPVAPAPPPPPPPPARPVIPDYPPPIGPEGFVVDAGPELLRWKPKTFSVVLPCAEEREFAYKTVESIHKMTPSEVLHEIVVVDDGSNPPLSETHLTPEIQQKFKVKIFRHEQTVGLIGAKKTGGDGATGDILVFLDCHVAPQKDWHIDILGLIAENYRRMVIPAITALDIDTWTQIGNGGGGSSKCYVTWDGDFKWGGTDDMYMGMLSGGLLGMSNRWWQESGGYDPDMFGWGGENIDQGVRMWVCGGEIVTAQRSQVAHMWRTNGRTSARYHHVGDTIKNRARAIYAWNEEFADKLDEYPTFAQRKRGYHGPGNWYGDMHHYAEVKKRLSGCRPFAWYIRRFKALYEDAGVVPESIFMLKEDRSGKCLLFMGSAGTSGSGREGVRLADCDENNDRFFWHLANRNKRNGKCCSGFRAWNTEQCLESVQKEGRAQTGICEVSGSNARQIWSLTPEGFLKSPRTCIGITEDERIVEKPCMALRNMGGSRFSKVSLRQPLETRLYKQAQRDHPEVFAKLNAWFLEQEKQAGPPGPHACHVDGHQCVALYFADGLNRCLDEAGVFTTDAGECAPFLIDGVRLKLAENGACLDTWSDQDPETWGFYDCHGGANQAFDKKGAARYCAKVEISKPQCFETRPWVG
mmetsp:Transcript_72514/g.172898  ORF Transcript_72514/g.172898 Transcript_72514/m.172898 type:complete len:761 (+) Transcript_72514:90-2372(+)